MLKNSIIGIAAIILAVISGLLAVGAVAKNKAPQLAVALKPLNGFAAENQVATAVTKMVAENGGQFPNRLDPALLELARSAFIAEPVTPKAIAVLALGSAQNIKSKMMGEALLLSRREQLVTGWMIADSGAREDVPAVLSHYDTMLRTNRSAASVIIPAMAGALGNDIFIAPLSDLLEKQPPWTSQFWGSVISAPGSLGNAARLREALYKPGENNEDYRDAELIRALVENQQFDQAQGLYRLLHRQKKTSSLTQNSSFETEPEYPPFDWQLLSTGEYGAIITDGKLQLSAISNSGGLFTRQLVKLPARVLTLDVNPDEQISKDAQLFVNLTCAQEISNAPQPIRIPLKSKIDSLQINNSRSGCSFYWLDINGRSSENGDGFDIALDSISLQ